MALPELQDSSGRLTDCIYFGDPILAATSLATLYTGVPSDVDLNPIESARVSEPFLWISVAGAAYETKLASSNGDLVIVDGGYRIASFGGGNGGSIGGTPIYPLQSRFLGHIYQEIDLTTFAPDVANTPQEAVRIIASSSKTDTSPSSAINITNGSDTGLAITQPGIYHGLQINIGALAADATQELGGVVAFLQQHGVSTTSIVAFDGSVQTSNDAIGPCANLVGLNIGVKQDNLGTNAGGCGQAIGTFVRQSGVGTSGHFGVFANGLNTAHLVDRAPFWDYTDGTITAAAGTTILGNGTTWTDVPQTATTVVSLRGKWITWTSTAGPKVSKRITVVNSDTSLTVSPAIAAGEVVGAGASYKILSTDPWDAIVTATGVGPSTAIDIEPDWGVASGSFSGIYAVETSNPDNILDKFGWTWHGVAKFSGVKTDHAAFQPPFVIPRISLANPQSITFATGAPVDITGVTTTFAPTIDCMAVVNYAADISYTSGSGTLAMTLDVNGTPQAVQVVAKQVAAGDRGTYANATTVALTSGVSYTFKLRAQASDSAVYSLAAVHTGMSIMALGKT